jgi:hypothetical protein
MNGYLVVRVHRCRRGSKVDTRAISSNNRRSLVVGVAGTMMRASA